jgi:hypothetical protein
VLGYRDAAATVRLEGGAAWYSSLYKVTVGIPTATAAHIAVVSLATGPWIVGVDVDSALACWDGVLKHITPVLNGVGRRRLKGQV